MDFVRRHLPSSEPRRAWSNGIFIASTGRFPDGGQRVPVPSDVCTASLARTLPKEQHDVLTVPDIEIAAIERNGHGSESVSDIDLDVNP